MKAFILGCDPTAFDKKGKPIKFETVFGIGTDPRYFDGILVNLNYVEIGLNQVYVQNLITDYQDQESSKNKNWQVVAAKYLDVRCAEFDQVDPTHKLPVFLTSHLLYKALLLDHVNRVSPRELYELDDLVPIPSESNHLKRPLIPLYRHYAYALSGKQAYAQRIRSWLKQGC